MFDDEADLTPIRSCVVGCFACALKVCFPPIADIRSIGLPTGRGSRTCQSANMRSAGRTIWATSTPSLPTIGSAPRRYSPFTVEDCARRLEVAGGRGHGGIAIGPVEAVACKKPDAAPVDDELGSIAVMLDLVNPSLALRWRIDQRGAHHRDEGKIPHRAESLRESSSSAVRVERSVLDPVQ
jgi:hypothetical protein